MQRERRTLSVPTIFVDQHQQPDAEMARASQSSDEAPSPAGLGMSGWPPSLQHSHSPLATPAALGSQLSASVVPKPTHHIARSRSASTSALTNPTHSSQSGINKKKIVTACQRCRTRKIRCDGALPACRSCVKAGVDCIEVDRSGDNNMPRSHVLELENRIKWLEEIVSTRCPDVDLTTGPPVELRSRPPPPAIRIVTTGPDFEHPQPMSNTSSPVFALSPASTCATPASFEFSSPGVSPGFLRPVSPFTFSDAGASPTPSPGPSSPLLQPFIPLPVQDTLSQEVGLLSLSLSEEPKYVGPSSGISFARMVFADRKDADIPGFGDDLNHQFPKPEVSAEPAALPDRDDCYRFSKAYFETVHLQYPFLHRPTFDACLAAILYVNGKGSNFSALPTGFTLETAQFHVLMVVCIGANVLSSGISNSLHATAMRDIDSVHLTGSLHAVQCALLLAMRSLYSSDGWSLWHLNSVIMASCVDLGLQRKVPVSPGEESKSALKRRVFWSAYALDRNIGVVMGRPFTVADDSIDVDFPDETENDDELNLELLALPSYPNPSARAIFAGTIYLLRMIKLTSTIHTTLYRVSPQQLFSPDLTDWQMMMHRSLQELREQTRLALGGVRRGSNPSSAHLLAPQMVELKYHEAIQLLFRPSPVFPRPGHFALQQCFNSGIESIRTYTKLRRHGELPLTRLTAHAVFLCGITMVYAYRTYREVQSTTANEVFAEDIRSCSALLGDLAMRWPAAAAPRSRFDALATSTLAVSSATASCRMLSPHDTARRRASFVEAPAIEVQQQQQQQWFQGQGQVDTSWDLGQLQWGGVGDEVMASLIAGDEDTTMWGMATGGNQ